MGGRGARARRQRDLKRQVWERGVSSRFQEEVVEVGDKRIGGRSILVLHSPFVKLEVNRYMYDKLVIVLVSLLIKTYSYLFERGKRWWYNGSVMA